jgi:hypothetical protein
MTKEHKAAIYLKQDEILAESKCRLQNVSNMWYSCLAKAANHLKDGDILFSYGVRLSPLGTVATVWPIVPALEDR